jgi:hypothetical protein
MIDDDVITRLVELQDHIQVPATPPGADAARGRQLLRRRRAMVAGATAAAVVAVLGVVAGATGGPTADNDPVRPGPTQGATPSPTDTPSTDVEWPLERIRAEGLLEDELVTESGVRARAYLVCDGPGSACTQDPPLRIPYQHAVLEVTQDGQSALFGLGANGMHAMQAFDDDSVLVVDDPLDQVDLERAARHRVLRADGSEVELQVVNELVPAIPGPDLFVVDYGEDASLDGFQEIYLVDLLQGTLRLLDVPRLQPDGRFLQHVLPTGLDARHWGPNVDQFLWFADRDCTVQWADEDGIFHVSEAGCGTGWDPPTYIRDDMFPDGWLQPGRLALLERGDGRLFVHVSLDYGDTWRRIPVNNEKAVPDTLRQLG